ncbi:MAG: hypothetical protein U5K71_10470 [Gracilimonas sp.]|nr:hypothetical protein [Gracilimonas sp.]
MQVKQGSFQDLHIDNDSNLWATAAEELGDSGPFNSIIYKVGTIQNDNVNPIQLIKEFEVYRAFRGYKVEGYLQGDQNLLPG